MYEFNNIDNNISIKYGILKYDNNDDILKKLEQKFPRCEIQHDEEFGFKITTEDDITFPSFRNLPDNCNHETFIRTVSYSYKKNICLLLLGIYSLEIVGINFVLFGHYYKYEDYNIYELLYDFKKVIDKTGHKINESLIYEILTDALKLTYPVKDFLFDWTYIMNKEHLNDG